MSQFNLLKKPRTPDYINILKSFLEKRLKLRLHAKKIILRKLVQGIDFCGYVILPYHSLPRTKTKRRICNRVSRQMISEQAVQSYLGYFSHANSFKVTQNLENIYFLKSCLLFDNSFKKMV